MFNHIGNIIFSLREELEISQKNLARGILSVSELSRIENGNKEVDKILLEALFQRLGKSIDKFEMTLSNEEYRILLLRSLILKCLIEKNYESIKYLLNEYEDYTKRGKALHRQYLLFIKAITNYIYGKDIMRSIDLLEQALIITFPEWKEEELDGYYLCTQEIQLLLVISYLMIEKNNMNFSEKILRKLHKYINKHYTDDEEKVKILPQCTWLLSKIYLSQGKIEKAYEICEKGKKLLVKNGVLPLVDELLDIEIICLKKLERKNEYTRIDNQKQAIKFIYSLLKRNSIEEKILYLISGNQLNEIVISNELIRELRISQNLSQEKLSENICTQETLSRIENGKRTPNRKNFHELLNKMDLNREIYCGVIITDDYKLYEKVRLFKRNYFESNKLEAHMLLDEISKKLDLTFPINRQFIESSQLIEEISIGNINYDEAILKLKNILCYTMKNYNEKVYRIPFREECVLLNQMALCMKKANRIEEAISIYEQILNKYEDSEVIDIHHTLSKLLICINYSSLLEENNKLKNAEKVGKIGINLAIDSGKGDVLGILLANLSCVYEKYDSFRYRKLCKSCLKNSYYLLSLYNHKLDSIQIKKYYETKYGIELK